MKPKLRFNDFKNEYYNCTLNDITEIIKDGTHGTHENVFNGIPLLSAKDIYDNMIHIPEDCRKISVEDYKKIYNNYQLKENDILMTIVGTIGRTALYKNENVAFQRSVATIRINNKNNPNYVRNYLESSKVSNQLNNMTNSSAQGGIYLNSLSKIKLSLPSKEEQIKISNFLSLLDKKIELQSKKIEDLKLFKIYLNVNLFNNANWKHVKLSEVLEISCKKNKDNVYNKNDVLSVSDEYGVVNQLDLQGRSFAASDLSNYKIVSKNQIIYTRSPLSAKPYGIIKIVDKYEGIVSPLYIVNNVKNGYKAKFIYYMFDLPSSTNNYLKPLVRLGAKHTMNISDEEWLSGEILVPNSTYTSSSSIAFKQSKKYFGLNPASKDLPSVEIYTSSFASPV